MINGLNRIIGILLFSLFIGGAVLIPSFHKAHCGDHQGTHDSSHCTICQVINNSPCIAASSHTPPVVQQAILESLPLEDALIFSSPSHSLTRARGPPVV